MMGKPYNVSEKDPQAWRVLMAISGAEAFIQGFDGDDAQEPGSIGALLDDLEKASADLTGLAQQRADLAQALRDCLGAMDALQHQIGQMRGMFDDADGTIQAACDDADAAEKTANAALLAVKP